MDINNIDNLNLSIELKNKLKEKHVVKIEDLWSLKRKDLKQLNFSNDDINNIIIQLQLLGLDLSKKSYKIK